MRASTQTEQQVIAVLDEWAAAYDRKDPDAYAATFSEDDDVLLFGTGSDEVVAGRDKIAELLQRDFEEADQLRVRLGDLHVSEAGEVAWAATHNAVVEVSAGGQDQTIPLRLTAVLQRRDGRWLIQHAHVSAPLAGQQPGHSFPSGEQAS